MVMVTELEALQDLAFEIVSNGEPLEQWYYQNSDIYKPDRTIDNLILTPQASATIPETGVSTALVFNTALTKWYYAVGNSNSYTEITATQDGQVDYYKSGNALVVKKNVVPLTPIKLKGEWIAYDPRDAATTYKFEETITLVSSLDSDPVYPKISVGAPPFQLFHPIKDETDNCFYFEATASWGDYDITSMLQFEWTLIDRTESMEEILIQNAIPYIEAPASFVLYAGTEQARTVYKGGQHQDHVLIDAWYGEHLTVICRARYTYSVVPDSETGNPSSKGWYERTVSDATISTGEENPKALGWYEYIYGMYIPSPDTVVDMDKHYYTLTFTLSSDTTKSASKTYWTTSGDLFPDKVYSTVSWEDFKIEPQAVCDGGNHISIADEERTFSTIVNIRHEAVSEEQKRSHLLFQWFRRISDSATEFFCGWGTQIRLTRSEMRQSGSNAWKNVLVYPIVYLRGAKRPVTYNGGVVTYNSETVYSRT